MSIPVREGRVFTERDSAKAPLVGHRSTSAWLAALWPGQSAVGKRFRVALPGQQPAWGEIVGRRRQHPPSRAGQRRRPADLFQLSPVHRRPDRARGAQPRRCARHDAGGPAGNPIHRSRAAGLRHEDDGRRARAFGGAAVAEHGDHRRLRGVVAAAGRRRDYMGSSPTA